MDKNSIKKFAVWARRELITRVSQRAIKYEIDENGYGEYDADAVNGRVMSAEEKTQRKALIDRIRKKGYHQVMDEVAYTWFNRFSALRFMEVNGYLPSRTRVFTDDNNNFKPQIITDAIDLTIDGLDMEKVYELKDDARKEEELYKYLLITQCNALSKVLPGMFQKISDYTELLFPDNLLREGSVVQQMTTMIPEDDWKDAVQIIGWLYQYYNTEKKDEVFAALKKNVKITKDNIPAATQLFTPDWIVRYMVENSLGRLWVEGHPNDDLKSKWDYYLEEAEQEKSVQTQLAEIRKEYANLKPEDIRVIDPCSGSGHILAYLFDVLMQIYDSYSYTTREAVDSIVTNNIYGLDIDERAAQLAYFAVMMKARQYDSRFLKRTNDEGNPAVPQPHVFAIDESNGIDSLALEYFCNGDVKLKAAMDTIVKEMHDAKEYGSIITVTPQDWSALYNRFDEIEKDISMYREPALGLKTLVQVAEMLGQKYDTVVTNPPYMKADNMSAKLAQFVVNYHEDAKYDLYSSFVYRCYDYTKKNGFVAMITMHNFMFNPSFQTMRNSIKNWNWLYMAHLGSRAFDEISGEVVQTTSYIIRKALNLGCLKVIDVTDGKSENEKEKLFHEKKMDYFSFDLQDIDLIPGNAFGYALSKKVINYYREEKQLYKLGTSKAGVVTGDDGYFVRNWFEVNYNEICSNPQMGNLYKYVRFSKGGSFNKWYGNTQFVLRLEDMWDDNKTNKSVRRGDRDFYYRKGIGWSQMGGGVNKAYSIIENAVCKTTTPMFYPNTNTIVPFIIAYLNSSIPPVILKALNPTLSILTSDITNLPFVYDEAYSYEISQLVDVSSQLSKKWYSEYEENWEFKTFNIRLEETVFEKSVEKIIEELKDDQEKMASNNKRIDEIFKDIMSLKLSENKSEIPFKEIDRLFIVIRFISYAVGCMFGRYSLDVEGLAYAGGEWDYSKYSSFTADSDNIIPICDDEYFEDDIVGRFVKFVEVVYGEDTLQENLKFIADVLGGKGQPKEVIRNYFLNGFYADHCKMYQKRPIYWLFDSGKKNGFKCLIYMHRYQPDTIARIRTDYVHEQQSRYRTALADIEQRLVGVSGSEKVKLDKQKATLQAQITEIGEYEEKIHHLADQMIRIDLDDGVKNNYEIFKDVLAKIN